jgi:beta-fructofuranosidase
MNLFYTPEHARVGDVIPFYENGLFKPFYLKNWNPYYGTDRTDGWHMLETPDNLHILSETPTGIRGGTGCVIRVNGMYHLFYCVFRREPQRQYVCHAVSPDLKQWTTLPEETFGPDEQFYLPTDWRDPFVFWNEEENCWWMALCAQAQGPTKRRGCVGLCKSEDLHSWTCCPPLYAPQASMSAYECPDVFYMNGWWYLVFSQFTDRFQTIYRMSRSLRGPWLRPRVDSFDGRAFYAAKTGTDGERRFIYGWNPTRTQNTWHFNPDTRHEGYDYNTYDWGGSMVVHEVWQHEDGTLAVRPIPALDEVLHVPNTLKWKPMNGSWNVGEEGIGIESPQAYASLLSVNEVPEVCRFGMKFSYKSGTDRIALAVQVDDEFARGYYFYFEPRRNRVEFKSALRMHEQGGWTFPWAVELERPLHLEPDRQHDVEIYIDHSTMVLYVDRDIAMSVRVYDLHNRKFGLAVADGSAEFTGIHLMTC